MAKKLKSHETSKLLALGEKLRENPKTILLSVPIFLIGTVWFSLKKDEEKLAGSFGHLGITFKNCYKHHWQQKFLLILAAKSFAISAKHAPLKDKPAVLLKLGQTWIELEKIELGQRIYEEGIKIAEKIKDFPMVGYILAHRGRLFASQKKPELAWQDLKKAEEYIRQGIKKRKDSLYYQIWLSGVELDISDYYLTLKETEKALEWVKKAGRRAEKFSLETRKLDAQKMLKKIRAVT